jgi:hypothetical protein
VSPGQTGMAAEIVGLMSQRVAGGIVGFLKVSVKGSVARKSSLPLSFLHQIRPVENFSNFFCMEP